MKFALLYIQHYEVQLSCDLYPKLIQHLSSTMYDGEAGITANIKSAVSAVKWLASRPGRFVS
jgi:hypothetical protein